MKRIVATAMLLGAWAAPPLHAKTIDAGERHVCVVEVAGAVRCWGYNAHGELGNNSDEPSSTPVLVEGLAGKQVVALASARFATCAIDAAGAAYCWGDNQNGELGNGSADAGSLVAMPVDMTPIPPERRRLVEITSGQQHFCGRDLAGMAWCWGANDYGQLGADTQSGPGLVPVEVATALSFVAIGASDFSTCGIDASGSVWCWGGFDEHATEIPTFMPALPGQEFHSLVDTNDEQCAVDVQGTVSCWEWDGLGAPVREERAAISPNAFLAMQSQDWCTGGRNLLLACSGNDYSGQLGDGFPLEGRDSWNSVSLTRPQAEVAMADGFVCSMEAAGNVHCWGSNDHGRLGQGYDLFDLVPHMVAGFSADTLRAGPYHTCASTPAGAWCWGANHDGQIGDGSSNDRAVPTPTSGHSIVDSFPGRDGFSCGFDAQGDAFCWGSNEHGRLGNGSVDDAKEPVPVWLPQGVKLVSLELGSSHACGLDQQGIAWCWGADDHGQLGVPGSQDGSAIPVKFDGAMFSRLAAGRDFTCGIVLGSREIRCWGLADNGRLGIGSPLVDKEVPTAVALQDNARFVEIKAGDGHVCAIQEIAAQPAFRNLFCWGYDAYGQVGDDAARSDRLQPTKITLPGGGTNFAGGVLTLGGNATCLQTVNPFSSTQPLPYCWGAGARGQLGNGQGDSSAVPREATLMPTASALALGSSHLCAVRKSDGAVVCVGDRTHGQLGDGRLGYSPLPLKVSGVVGYSSEVFRNGFETP